MTSDHHNLKDWLIYNKESSPFMQVFPNQGSDERSAEQC